MSTRSLLLALSVLLLVALPASAQVLYENGPINGDFDAFTINFGFVVADSFTISSPNAAVNGLSFGVWVFPGDQTNLTAEVSLTSNPFGGTTYFDHVESFTTSDCGGNSYGFLICDATTSFNGPTLAEGTYFLNLSNASVPSGDPVYWDENSGAGCQSPGCPSLALQTNNGTIPSESFTILGTSGGGGTVPEPASLLLIIGGLMASAGILRRGLR